MTTDDGGVCVVCLLFAPSGGVVRYGVCDSKSPDDEVVVCLKCARGLVKADAAFESVVRINNALLERIAALEGHLLGIRLWATEQSEQHDAFTRRNGGRVVKPNVFDSLVERVKVAGVSA